MQHSAESSALGQITAILAAAGDPNPLDTLLPLVHGDLRRLARAQRRQMEPGETLSTTALVNEAYLKLRRADYPGLANRAHFFSLVARAMRQILIDHARSRLAEARRMDHVERELRDKPAEDARELAQLLEIDSALNELEKTQPRLAEVVLYRYFAGYSAAETAELLEVTERTINRDWQKARAFLSLALDQPMADGDAPA
ncbi:MAG: ECF-type sigma factor [Aquimonas sp.]|nr:ECF-type sigma factor [Aquimonas sp.]